MANSILKPYFGVRNSFGRGQLDAMREQKDHTIIRAIPFWWETGILAIAPSGANEYQLTLDASTATATDLNTVLANVGAFPEKVHVLGAKFELLEVFSGGAVSACTAEAGDSGTTDGYITAIDVFTGATTGLIGALGSQLDNENFVYEADHAPSITLRTTSADTEALTAGKIRYRIFCVPNGLLGS